MGRMLVAHSQDGCATRPLARRNSPLFILVRIMAVHKLDGFKPSSFRFVI